MKIPLGPAQFIDGVVYPSSAKLSQYVQAGVLTSETLADALKGSFAASGHRYALLGPGGDITYAQLDDITDRLAAALLRLGLEPLDRVLFQLGNSNELIYLFVACIKASLIPVCTLAAHREHEIGYLGRLSDARLHIVAGDDQKFDDVAFAENTAEKHLPQVKWIIQARGAVRGRALSLELLINSIGSNEAKAMLARVPRDPFQVAVFQLSGGTTAVPKIIPRFHSEYLYNMRAVAAANGYAATDTLFMPLPMMHNLSMGCCFGPFLLTGGAVMVNPSLDVEALLDTLRRYQPTWAAFGALLPRLRPAIEAGDLKLTRLKCVVAPNGAPKLRELLGVPVRHIFGMTEGVIMLTREGDPPIVADTMIGRPVSALDEVRIFRPGTENEIREEGVEGECAFAGPYTIHGYFKAQERDREAFTRSGMYRSGDLMLFRDVDGVRYFQFRGRTKDVLDRGGEKINCEEVEEIIRRHPAIANAQVCGMPDPVLGERVCAFVQARPACTAPGVSELAAFLEKQGLAKFKWPERVEPIADFPVTKTGKLSKLLLRQLIADKLAAESAANTRG